MNMDLKDIPKQFVIFLVVLIAFIIFMFAVINPLMNNFPVYESDHATAVQTIAKYEDTNARQAEIQQNIDDLTKQYNEKQEQLFVDSKTSIEDLQAIFKKLGIGMVSLTRGESVADTSGRTSTGGIPLYSTALQFTYKGTVDTTNDLIHYLEQDSKGCYFINTLTMIPVSDSSDYNVSFTVTLFYFNSNPSQATGTT